MGLVKPTHANDQFLSFHIVNIGMRKPKAPKAPSQLRAVIARNVDGLARVKYHGHSNMVLALAKDAKVSKSTVQRIIEGEVGVGADQLEAVAAALDALPYQLLIPNLDLRNPQVVRGAYPGETRAYGHVRIKNP